MELKVWVGGLERVVCGLTEATTCQETIYALAHATAKTGRFVLVEEWRSVERSLSPTERPLELLRKWGEHGDEVRFLLKCLDDAQPMAVPSSPYQPLRSPASPYSTGSLPRLRIPQRPPIPAMHGKGPAPQPSAARPIHNGVSDVHQSRLAVTPTAPRGLGFGSFGAGSTLSNSSSVSTLGPNPRMRKGSGRSTSSGSATRRPPPPSYNEALTRLQTLGKGPAPQPPSPLPSSASATSIDAPGGSYQFPASRQQLVAMIQHHERQLRTQGQRLGLCDQKISSLSSGNVEEEEAELSRLELQLAATRTQIEPLQLIDHKLQLATKAGSEVRSEVALVRSKTADLDSQLAAKAEEIRSLEERLKSEGAAEEAPTSPAQDGGELTALTAEIAKVEAALREKQSALDTLVRSLSNGNLNASRESAPEIREEEPAAPKRPGVWV